MRVMATSSGDGAAVSEEKFTLSRRRQAWLPRIRPAVQAAFAVLWLWPIQAFQSLPGCVFHCYGCPWSSFACPIGLMANFAAAAPNPSLAAAPLLLAGVLLVAGGLVGSLICGWMCPFGYLQDLLAHVPVPKIAIPNVLGHFRYVVLLGLVIALPWWLGAGHGGKKGVPYEQQSVSICRLCPAGGIEAALPYSIRGLARGQGWKLSHQRVVIITAFLAGSIIMFRPWCKIFCPLGGFLSFFNRVSIFHLRFKRQACYACNTCRSRCAMGVEVERHVNVTQCIRCTECTTCGAIYPSLGGKE
jgi:ferredoxin-type protein NapH